MPLQTAGYVINLIAKTGVLEVYEWQSCVCPSKSIYVIAPRKNTTCAEIHQMCCLKVKWWGRIIWTKKKKKKEGEYSPI